jgi:hypothetical protein
MCFYFYKSIYNYITKKIIYRIKITSNNFFDEELPSIIPLIEFFPSVYNSFSIGIM